MAHLLDRFELQARGSSVAREFRGAVATFLTMAYILAVNPGILSAAGVPFHAAVASTALAAGICSIAMGWFANFPIALASGMGLNAMVAFGIAKAAGSWQAAMGLIVLDGIVTAILVLIGLREAIMRAIPRDLRLSIGAGIGLFIAFIGLVNGELVVRSPVGPPVMPGNWHKPEVWTTIIGLLVTAFLVARKVKGALILGIVITTGIALFNGLTKWNFKLEVPSFAAMFQADLKGAFKVSLLPLLFGVIMVDFFDTLGTASAVAEEAKLSDKDGRFPKTKSVLLVDSLSASVGGLLGASSVTSYIESAAGVGEGARTGLHSIFVGIFFLLCMFAAPIVGMVPPCATAPALILVGFLMMTQISQINFEDRDTAIAGFVTLLVIPMTYSISHGIGYGLITFVVIKLLSLKWLQVHPLMYLTAAAFAAFFVWGE